MSVTNLDQDEVDRLHNEFIRVFVDPSEILEADPDDVNDFAWGTRMKWTTDYAVEHLFGGIDGVIAEALIAQLNDIAQEWVDREEV